MNQPFGWYPHFRKPPLVRSGFQACRSMIHFFHDIPCICQCQRWQRESLWVWDRWSFFSPSQFAMYLMAQRCGYKCSWMCSWLELFRIQRFGENMDVVGKTHLKEQVVLWANYRSYSWVSAAHCMAQQSRTAEEYASCTRYLPRVLTYRCNVPADAISPDLSNDISSQGDWNQIDFNSSTAEESAAVYLGAVMVLLCS